MLVLISIIAIIILLIVYLFLSNKEIEKCDLEVTNGSKEYDNWIIPKCNMKCNKGYVLNEDDDTCVPNEEHLKCINNMEKDSIVDTFDFDPESNNCKIKSCVEGYSLLSDGGNCVPKITQQTSITFDKYGLVQVLPNQNVEMIPYNRDLDTIITKGSYFDLDLDFNFGNNQVVLVFSDASNIDKQRVTLYNTEGDFRKSTKALAINDLSRISKIILQNKSENDEAIFEYEKIIINNTHTMDDFDVLSPAYNIKDNKIYCGMHRGRKLDGALLGFANYSDAHFTVVGNGGINKSNNMTCTKTKDKTVKLKIWKPKENYSVTDTYTHSSHAMGIQEIIVYKNHNDKYENLSELNSNTNSNILFDGVWGNPDLSSYSEASPYSSSNDPSVYRLNYETTNTEDLELIVKINDCKSVDDIKKIKVVFINSGFTNGITYQNRFELLEDDVVRYHGGFSNPTTDNGFNQTIEYTLDSSSFRLPEIHYKKYINIRCLNGGMMYRNFRLQCFPHSTWKHGFSLVNKDTSDTIIKNNTEIDIAKSYNTRAFKIKTSGQYSGDFTETDENDNANPVGQGLFTIIQCDIYGDNINVGSNNVLKYKDYVKFKYNPEGKYLKGVWDVITADYDPQGYEDFVFQLL